MDSAWADEETHRVRMEEAGFRDVGVQTVEMRFPAESAEGYTRYWFEGRNPVQDMLVEAFRGQGGDVDAARKEVERIVREEFDDGRGLVMTSVIGWGWK